MNQLQWTNCFFLFFAFALNVDSSYLDYLIDTEVKEINFNSKNIETSQMLKLAPQLKANGIWIITANFEGPDDHTPEEVRLIAQLLPYIKTKAILGRTEHEDVEFLQAELNNLPKTNLTINVVDKVDAQRILKQN